MTANRMYTIELAAAVSTDPNYSGVDPVDVSVSNTDDDAAPPSITLTVLPNTLGEGDSATNVTVTATFDGGTTVPAATNRGVESGRHGNGVVARTTAPRRRPSRLPRRLLRAWQPFLSRPWRTPWWRALRTL